MNYDAISLFSTGIVLLISLLMITGCATNTSYRYGAVLAVNPDEIQGCLKQAESDDNCSIYHGEVEKDVHYLFKYIMSNDADIEIHKPWARWEEVFFYKGSNFDTKAQRYGSIIGIEKENILVYTQMHAVVWPGVIAQIEACNIRNYSIFLGQIKDGSYLLFSYFDYIGDDFDTDMKNIASEVTMKWWEYTDPLQRKLSIRKEGEHWSSMKEVFNK